MCQMSYRMGDICHIAEVNSYAGAMHVRRALHLPRKPVLTR
jgi:hypothetical protein